MVSFELTPEQQDWLHKARELAKVFGTRARGYDEKGQFPHEDMNDLRDGGFLSLAVPKEYGGNGNERGFCTWLPHLVIEQIAVESGSTAWCLQNHYHATGIISGIASHEQKQKIFREVVEDGALIASVGSEVQPQQMKAANASAGPLLTWESGLTPTPGGFLANGRKGFCSIAKEAKYLVFWSNAPGTIAGGDGLSMALIPCSDPGITWLPGWSEVIGIRSSESGGADFKNVFVPWENVYGQPGDYVQIHPYTFELSYAMLLLGLGQGALNFIRSSLQSREFLQEDDTVMYAYGEMSSEMQAVRTSCYYAQWLWEEGNFEEAHQASLRALHSAKVSVIKVCTQGFDVVGTRGLFKFNPLERIWRDARVVSLHTRESSFMRLLSIGELRGDKHTKKKYGEKLETRKTWSELLNDYHSLVQQRSDASAS
uniref:acyl-CoA dehydrogenase family protein n=1 Tax=Aminobacter niigataensis TaxID=83265 RepID=UPI0028525F26|nr:acyl-CoA dehydrogenase family protein [Aminobacter niigataensis]WMD00082.1 acyl-CoA dehydrogenase family protein [Aminobacter niigataensis]